MAGFEVLAGAYNNFVKCPSMTRSTTAGFTSRHQRSPAGEFAVTPGPAAHASIVVTGYGQPEAVIVMPTDIYPTSPQFGLVPIAIEPGSQTTHIADCYQDNCIAARNLHGPTTTFAPNAGSASLIQSDDGNPVAPGSFVGGPSNLECVVYYAFDQLTRWWRTQDDVWHSDNQPIVQGFPGGAVPCLATDGGGMSANNHADFHLIFPTNDATPTIAHWVRAKANGSGLWARQDSFGSGLGPNPARIVNSLCGGHRHRIPRGDRKSDSLRRLGGCGGTRRLSTKRCQHAEKPAKLASCQSCVLPPRYAPNRS